MRFDVITLFPEMFVGPLSESIIKRAQEKGLIEINYHLLRDFAIDKHKSVDDTPCGGGKGMVIRVDIVDTAITKIKNQKSKIKNRIVLLTPRGRRFDQDVAKELSTYDNLILICGHYEGFDERVRDLVDEEISIGDFVLSGGEIPAMAIVDAVSRLVPGVLAKNSADDESFMKKDSNGEYLLEHPQYTRPIDYKGKKVPEVLLLGNHKEIEKWRTENRIENRVCHCESRYLSTCGCGNQKY